MRQTKGHLNNKEFIKIKPDLCKNAVRGVVTAEIIDSESGEIVQSCQSENIITDAFYRNALAFYAEDFINGAKNSGVTDVSFFATPVNSEGDQRARSFGLLVLSKTGLPENENPKIVEGAIAGTAVVSNNVSRAEPWSGNLRNPQSTPTVDSNNNVHFTRKFEFSEPKIVNRPFDTLYWLPSHLSQTQTNIAQIMPTSRIRFDTDRLRAINGAGNFSDTQSATMLPAGDTYERPSGVTFHRRGTRWGDMPYCFLSGYISSMNNSRVVWKCDLHTGQLLESREFTIISGTSVTAAYKGRTYVGFMVQGRHPVTDNITTYIIRCNNKTGEIDISAGNNAYPNSDNHIVDEDGNVRVNGTKIDFATGTVTTLVNANDIDIPQWLYPTSGTRPTVGTITSGIDTFDVSLSGTYFGTVIATFDYNMSFKMLQNTAMNRYRGVGILDTSSTQGKIILPPPTVMYKFPTEVVKNESQILIITYELIIPAEIISVFDNFLW